MTAQSSGRPPLKPAVEPPFRHLIEESKHRLQQVTCTCGWTGSSASPDGRNSEWKSHLAQFQSPRR